jgi:hypothetical protein
MVARERRGHLRAAGSGDRHGSGLRQPDARNAAEWRGRAKAIHGGFDFRLSGDRELGQPLGDAGSGRRDLYRDARQHAGHAPGDVVEVEIEGIGVLRNPVA